MLEKNKLIDEIAERGWFYQENAFPENFIQKAVENFSSFNLKEAGVGQTRQRHQEIRTDKIFWLEKYHHNPVETQYLEFFEDVQNDINQNLYMGLNDSEVHYAKYEPGGFYKPHYDNLKGKNNRIITLITYLNQNWTPSHGGTLKLHLPEGIKEIEPKAGTVVAFLSEKVLHEVSQSFCNRHSFTGWFLKKNSVV